MSTEYSVREADDPCLSAFKVLQRQVLDKCEFHWRTRMFKFAKLVWRLLLAELRFRHER